MGLPEELYTAMLEVGYTVRRHKVPGPLAPTMIEIAQRSLELWREDERLMRRFADGVLSGPTNLRATTGQLPEPVASACWRLITLLEYLHGSEVDSKADETLLQPKGLLEGASGN